MASFGHYRFHDAHAREHGINNRLNVKSQQSHNKPVTQLLVRGNSATLGEKSGAKPVARRLRLPWLPPIRSRFGVQVAARDRLLHRPCDVSPVAPVASAPAS